MVTSARAEEIGPIKPALAGTNETNHIESRCEEMSILVCAIKLTKNRARLSLAVIPMLKCEKTLKEGPDSAFLSY